MIPKKIHYCWFGKGKKPKLAEKCIKSWRKYCPDYEIIEWNEDNFQIEKYPYAKWCLENKKYAFLSDFVRLAVVAEYGGIYFDTDVEVIKPFDDLLGLEAFYGFENDKNVATGLGFGAQANHSTIVAMKELYLKLKANADGSYPNIACPKLNTEPLISLGLLLDGKTQNVAGATIFSKEYFNPYEDATGRLFKTKNTYSIHWYSKSWINARGKLRSKLTRPIHRLFGVNALNFLKRNK